MLNVPIALFLCSAGSALADVHYVDVNSTNATPPYTNWTTAATNMQDAVDAAVAGDDVVVTNGVYYLHGQGSTSGLVTVDKPLNVRSVNGPQFTTIDGGNYDRCVYLTNGASLSGFTLTRGIGLDLGGYGGGVIGGALTNCVLARNWAVFGGGAYYCNLVNCTLSGNLASSSPGDEAYGGGAYFCTLNNCTLSGNSAGVAISGYITYGYGGGAYQCTLNNCTLTGNSASGTHNFGGGAAYCGLYNCIVWLNFASQGANLYGSNPYSCWTADARFGNRTNFHLQPNSPCINAGNNSFVTSATDLDGNPRISGGSVDIGAYEYQWPQLTITPSGPNALMRWPTNNAAYDYTGFTLQSTTNLISPAVWNTNSPAPVVIAGQNTVTNPITGAQKFYRLVQ
jgi:hypothetical protein